MKNYIWAFMVVMTFILTGCEPQFSVNGEYQKCTFTYAIFNTGDSYHYVKIYKGFLTDNNTFSYIENMTLNDLYYIDSIEVSILRYKNGQIYGSPIKFDTTTSLPKDQGLFPNPTQILYKNVSPFRVDSSLTYRLRIINKYTQDTIFADENLPGTFYITAPMTGVGNMLDLTDTKNINCTFGKPLNAVGYNVYQTFYYIERDKITGDTVHKKIRRYLGEGHITNNSTSLSHNNYQIYNLIANNIVHNDNVVRFVDTRQCVEYEVWVAAKELYRYMQVGNNNSTTFNNKVVYTNFKSKNNNAYGIFSGRTYKSHRYLIDQKSEDSLVLGSYTKKLGFRYFREF